MDKTVTAQKTLKIVDGESPAAAEVPFETDDFCGPVTPVDDKPSRHEAEEFYDYEKREGFSHSVKRARMLVEAEYERRLHGNNVGGAIFALKNHGWSDRQEHAHSRTDSGLSQLSDDELRELLQKRVADITSRLRASGAAEGGNGRAGQGA